MAGRKPRSGAPDPHGLGGASHSVATLTELNSKVSDATLIDTTDPRLSDARTPTAHVHDAADVTSGTMANARIAESNVTQHEGALDHDALVNFVLGEHRLLDDAVESLTTLYSSTKIQAVVDAAVVGLLDFKGGYDAGTNTPDLDSTPIAGILKGDVYVVTVDGVFFTEQLRAGDQIFAQQDTPTTLAHWARVERNIDNATTTVKGIVELATNGEDAANVVVQGNDDRLDDNRTDIAAIHDDVAAEIVAITEKVSPLAPADLLILEDSGDANAKKKIQIANIIAADIVINSDGTFTQVQLQAAFDALPAGGGTVYAKGKFLISATVNRPNKPHSLVGAGRGVTIFDLESSAIAVFTDANDNTNTDRDYSIHGDNTTALQKGVVYSNGGAGSKTKNFERVDFGGAGSGKNIFRSVDAGAGAQNVHFTDCNSRNRAGTETDSAFFFGDGEAKFLRCSSVTSAIIEDGSTLEVFITDCYSLDITGTAMACRKVRLSNSEFTGDKGIQSGLGGGSAVDCTFRNTNTGATLVQFGDPSATDSRLIGCIFIGGATRGYLAGVNGQVIGNNFQPGAYVTADVRITKANVTVIGDGKTLIEEATGALNGRYSGIDPASTIIAASKSIIDGATTEIFTTGTHALTRDHRTVLGNTAGGNITFDLPVAATARHTILTIKKINASNTITIDGNASETIDGALTRVLSNDDEGIKIQSDGAEWHILTTVKASSSAHFYKDDNTQVISSDSNVNVILDATAFNGDDDNYELNVSTGVVTIKKAGLYDLAAATSFDQDTASATSYRTLLRKSGAEINGTRAFSGVLNASGQADTAVSAATLRFVANDTVEVRVRRWTGSGEANLVDRGTSLKIIRLGD